MLYITWNIFCVFEKRKKFEIYRKREKVKKEREEKERKQNEIDSIWMKWFIIKFIIINMMKEQNKQCKEEWWKDKML